jgi:hypothetical protein
MLNLGSCSSQLPVRNDKRSSTVYGFRQND